MEEQELKVIKRDGREVVFNKTKIRKAIVKAMQNGGAYLPDIARIISNDAENYFLKSESVPTISSIEKYIYKRLNHYGQTETARAYEAYRAVAEFRRLDNTIDGSIISLIRGDNIEVRDENSNKNATIAPTQRDLIAGEVSKDLARRMLFPVNIIQAHDSGAIHLHDSDYAIQRIFNCCLVDIKEMLDNGTVINGTLVESPKGFQTACTIMTQIISSVASGQFGGQSVNIKHLGRYLKRAEDKHRKMFAEGFDFEFMTNEQKIQANELIDYFTEIATQKELEAGIQTIQYQINTIASSNGQSPFVTLFLHLDDEDEYVEYSAKIIYEILKQRYIGIKNEFGMNITPPFPKLVYVLDENNVHADSKYNYITKMAAKCSAKRMYPDYISAKVMREIHKGSVFSCMGKCKLQPM